MSDTTIPTHLHLEDGAIVAHAVGTRVFDYYSMKVGTITRTATHADRSLYPNHELDGGAWWVDVTHDDGSRTMLDQSRMCSIEYARRRGWLK